jgi:hypothetical protein
VPAIKVPKEYKSAIEQIVTADDSVFGELMSALEGAPLVFRYQELADNIAPRIKTISSEVSGGIVLAFTSLYSVVSTAGVPVEKLVDDLVEGIEQSDLKETLAESTLDKVKQRFVSLLRNRAIRFASKAIEIQKNYGKAFCMAEMLTDIRPIFVSEDKSPMAAICSNILKITYHEKEELKDIFFALMPSDLDTLEDLIDQARAESQQLQSILDKAGVAHPNGTGKA